MNDQLVVLLKQQWMTENEAKIYLAMLQYNGGVASSLARITGVNRATTYTVLNEMKKKWRARTLTKNDITTFYPIDFQQLFQQLEQQYISFKEALPALDTLSKQYTHQKAQLDYYDGEEGVKKVLEMTLQSKTPLYAILTDQTYNPNLKKWLENVYLPERVKRKIQAYCVVDYSDENQLYKSKDQEHLRETKMINAGDFEVSGEICIFDNKVIHIYADKGVYYAVVHTSESYYRTMYSVFQQLRAISEPF